MTNQQIIDIRKTTTPNTFEAWSDTVAFGRAIEAAVREEIGIPSGWSLMQPFSSGTMPAEAYEL